MHNIKVGDTIVPYGLCYIININKTRYFNSITLDNAFFNKKIKATVIAVSPGNIVFTVEDTVTHGYEAHPKQCRLVIKVRTCKKCAGSGRNFTAVASKDFPFLPEEHRPMEAEETECDECEGRGKIKIKPADCTA